MEMNPLADIYDLDPSATYLNSILGVGTPAGVTIGSIFQPGDVIARMGFRPEVGEIAEMDPACFLAGA